MACATPNYAEGDVPPSYSEVIKSIEAATGNNTMPQQLLHVIEGLSAPERKVLSDIAQTSPPKMTDEEKKKSAISMAKGLSAPEGQELLKGTAKDVARAASSVKGGFRSLKLKLSELENTAKSNFLSKLQTHEQVRSICFFHYHGQTVNAVF